MIKLRGVFMTDSPRLSPAEYERAQREWRRGVHDEVLTPMVTSGGTLVNGKTWEGALAPELDRFLDSPEVKPFTRGFITGHVVGAGQVPATLNLGTVYSGAFEVRSLLGAAAASYSRGRSTGDDVDITEVAGALERVISAAGANDPDLAAIGDSLQRLKAAGDRRPRRSTADAFRARDQQMRAVIASRNAANKTFWDEKRDADLGLATQTHDSQSAVRDAARKVNAAATMRDKLAAMNELNRASAADRAAVASSRHPIDAHARGRR